MYQLSPSILAADFNCLGEQIRQVEEAGVELLHIDVWMEHLFRVFPLGCRLIAFHS